MMQEIIIGLLTFIFSSYIAIIFKLKPIIDKDIKKKEEKFFTEIGITTKVNKDLFENWVKRYYKINEPKENLHMFHREAIVLIILLLISLAIDVFIDKIPKEVFNVIGIFVAMTLTIIVLFFMNLFYLLNWYMKEYKE